LVETHGLAPKVLAAVNRHLDRQGLLLRQGTIVDATIIHAPSSTNNTGTDKRAKKHGRRWYIAAKRGTVKAIQDATLKRITQELEYVKADVRAKVEHPSHCSGWSSVSSAS
jgi:IS5 family transposase